MSIPDVVCQEVRARSGDQCEGLYKRILFGIDRLGDCPCNGRFPLIFAHIKHRGMGGSGSKSRDTADNILQLCRYAHDLFDQRITRREFDSLMKEEKEVSDPSLTGLTLLKRLLARFRMM